MTYKMFGGYVKAVKNGLVVIHPITVTATDINTALTIVNWKNITEVFPIGEGYYLHTQELIEATEDQMKTLKESLTND
jgi:hypothetical protein